MKAQSAVCINRRNPARGYRRAGYLSHPERADMLACLAGPSGDASRLGLQNIDEPLACGEGARFRALDYTFLQPPVTPVLPSRKRRTSKRRSHQ